jgi:hypothetical protein
MELRLRPCVVWNCGSDRGCYRAAAAIVREMEPRQRSCLVSSGGRDRVCYGAALATVRGMELRKRPCVVRKCGRMHAWNETAAATVRGTEVRQDARVEWNCGSNPTVYILYINDTPLTTGCTPSSFCRRHPTICYRTQGAMFSEN